MLFKTKIKTETKTKQAFTLAEVLITLSIIGVVAALTIPTLIQRTGDEEIIARLSKTYSTLSQATEAIITEQGSPKIWVTDAGSIYDIYKEHLRNSKECSTGKGCWVTNDYKYLDGAATRNWDNAVSWYRLILSDNVLIMFSPDRMSQSCKNVSFGSTGRCAEIWVDVNGSKGPNIVGRDTFEFVIKENGLYPAGCDDDEKACTNNTFGHGCACRVLREGKIDY